MQHTVNDNDNVQIGCQYPASAQPVIDLLSMPVNDGRSQWYWITLANGDVMLAFYPQADGRDGFYSTEVDREADYDRALVGLPDTFQYLTARIEDVIVR